MKNNLKSAVAFFFLFFLHETSIGKRQQGIARNVFSLCVRAGFGVQNCQPALMPNRSTTLELPRPPA